MKKFAYMLAALSLCTVSFVACDDDKDTDTDQPKVECNSNDDCKDNAEGKTVCESNKCVAPAASDKEDCSSNDDCKDNSNGKTVCESNKCVAPSTEEPECSKDADCAENEEGKTSCNAGKCDYPNDDDVCDAASYQIICENGGASAWVCKDSKITKEDCGEGKECKDGQGCVEKHDEGECYTNDDCAAKGADYFCNDNKMCEQKVAKDPCKDISCNDGFSCLEGICVSEAMKALVDGDAYPSASPTSFCKDGNLIYRKDADGTTGVVNCVENGYSGCVVFVDREDGTTRIADCNAQKSVVENCNKRTMDACVTPSELYEVYCMQDILENDIAVPTYSGDNDGKCEEGKSCVMEGESASCK